MQVYGRFISSNKSTMMVRVPGCKQENFHLSLSSYAMDRRDQLCEMHGIDPKKDRSTQEKRLHVVNHTDKIYSDLPVGLSRGFDHHVLSNGVEITYISISATACGKRKSFGATKIGEREAIVRAFVWRCLILKANGQANMLTESVTKNYSYN